jgi:glycerol kinase
MRAPRPALALDLGSTRIKAARFVDGWSVGPVASEAAPRLRGSGVLREGDVEAYAAAVERVMDEVGSGLPPGTPLGIASQRSTFALWKRRDGTPVTPLVSWQDRRAADWCARHGHLACEVLRRTGLQLSAHYVGPKLATLLAAEPDLERGAARGDLRFGTLETRLLWQWTRGRRHETDLSMGARTLMLDLDDGRWSPPLLDAYGVPEALLPRIVPTAGRSIPVGRGLELRATVADQAAGALAVLGPDPGTVLITLGTGGFVLTPAGPRARPRAGYLLAPILGSGSGPPRLVFEGTVNGAGAAIDRFRGTALDLPARDPLPGGFCIPDVSGLGSPYWKPRVGLTFSEEADGASTADKLRIVVEGLLFRLREIVEDLRPDAGTGQVRISGGVTREPRIARGLASLLGRPVEVLDDQEAGLLGAARLAAGIDPFAEAATTRVDPGPTGAYLGTKYAAWRDWLASTLQQSDGAG